MALENIMSWFAVVWIAALMVNAVAGARGDALEHRRCAFARGLCAALGSYGG